MGRVLEVLRAIASWRGFGAPGILQEYDTCRRWGPKVGRRAAFGRLGLFLWWTRVVLIIKQGNRVQEWWAIKSLPTDCPANEE